MRAEPFDDSQGIGRYFCHARLPCLSLITIVQVLTPQAALRQAEQRPPAPWTDFLKVAPACQTVLKSELSLHHFQVPNHRQRRVRLRATPAERLFTPAAGVLVEPDAELRRTLKDVKQLAKRQPEQRHDDSGGVQD